MEEKIENFSFLQPNNNSVHVVERRRTAVKCTKLQKALALRAKLLFFIVRYANCMTFLSLLSSWFL